jgi:hypothetical protein
MGRDAKRAKQARRDKRKRLEPPQHSITVGPSELERLAEAWDEAVRAGLMEDGCDVSYHRLSRGRVISTAVGLDGQVLVDGRELTAAWADELRRSKPAFAGLIDIFEEKARQWTRLSAMGPGRVMVPNLHVQP